MNREYLAELYEKANGWSPAPFKITMGELERFAALVAAAEREACVQEADAHASVEGIAQRIAAAIRARGQS